MSYKLIQLLPEWATAEEIQRAVSFKDRRTLDKWPIRKVQLSKRCTRYNTRDLAALIRKRTIGKEVFRMNRDSIHPSGTRVIECDMETLSMIMLERMSVRNPDLLRSPGNIETFRRRPKAFVEALLSAWADEQITGKGFPLVVKENPEILNDPEFVEAFASSLNALMDAEASDKDHPQS